MVPGICTLLGTDHRAVVRSASRTDGQRAVYCAAVLASSGAPAAENRKGAEPPQASYAGPQKPLTDVQCLVSDGPSVSFGLFVMLCHDCQFPEES